MTRAEILDKAKEIVTKDRNDQYGEPEDSFQIIAELWTAFFGLKFTKEDVAVMMLLLKVARIRSGHSKNDSWIDIAGYAACGGELASK